MAFEGECPHRGYTQWDERREKMVFSREYNHGSIVFVLKVPKVVSIPSTHRFTSMLVEETWTSLTDEETEQMFVSAGLREIDSDGNPADLNLQFEPD